MLWAPRPSGVLGWLSCVRGASPSGTRGAGRRESHFGGRHRTSRYRIRCLQGVHGSRGTRRGTRRPDIDSRPLGAVFIRIRSRSCIDRSSSRVPRHAHPAALCPPQGEERSDQIKAAGATRDPRRPKWSVVNSQGHGDHPAAASRRRTPSYKFTSTRLRTLTPPPPHAPCAPLALTTCAPSVPHATAGLTSPSGECSACASPIFVESASPPGTACAALGALFCPARAPRGSTRDPRGAGGPSGPWGSARTCSACASWPSTAQFERHTPNPNPNHACLPPTVPFCAQKPQN